MRLTVNTRVLKSLHDRRGLAITATTSAAPEAEPTFSASQLRAIMQSPGLSRAEAMEIDDKATASARRLTASRMHTTSTPAKSSQHRAGCRKRTATGATKSVPRISLSARPTTLTQQVRRARKRPAARFTHRSPW